MEQTYNANPENLKLPTGATDEQLTLAKEDGAILEAKLESLISEFENKHHPIQVSVVTRWRSVDDKYNLDKGGAAQVVYHDRSCSKKDKPDVILSALLMTPIKEIVYAEGGSMKSSSVN